MLQVQQFPQEQVDKYYEIAKKCVEDLKTLAPLTPENEWHLSSDKHGFKIHTKPDHETGLCYTRGEGFLPFTTDEIFEIIEAVDIRPQYDSLCESGHIMVRISDDLLIFYQKFKSMMFVVSSRDFVVLSYKHKEGNITYATGRSIDFGEKHKGNVRADLKLGGWVLEEKEGGTNCIFITWADPKGNLPHFAVNAVASVQGEVVEKVGKLLERRKQKQKK